MRDKISLWLRRCTPWAFVPILLIASYIIILPFAFLKPDPNQAGPNFRSMGVVGQFIIASVVAPIIETALNQALPIYLLRKYTRLRWFAIIVIPSAIFGLMHFYSIQYIVYAFLVGLVLTYSYAVRRYNGGHPFTLVALIHALRNTISIIITNA